MELDVLNVVIPLITSTISGVIAYVSAKGKNRTEIEKLNITQKTEMQKVIIQQELVMKQFEQQQKLEIEKIKEKHEQEIKKLNNEIDKQAELYEKNAQTDIISSFMSDVIKGDMKGFNNLMGVVTKIESYDKK